MSLMRNNLKHQHNQSKIFQKSNLNPNQITHKYQHPASLYFPKQQHKQAWLVQGLFFQLRFLIYLCFPIQKYGHIIYHFKEIFFSRSNNFILFQYEISACKFFTNFLSFLGEVFLASLSIKALIPKISKYEPYNFNDFLRPYDFHSSFPFPVTIKKSIFLHIILFY